MRNTVAKKESVKGRWRVPTTSLLTHPAPWLLATAGPRPHTSAQNAETIDTAPPFRTAFRETALALAMPMS